MDGQTRQHTTVENFPAARELAVWLSALQSFFNQANHPFTDSERANISARNFKCETQIARDALLRCLQLLGSIARADSTKPPSVDEGDTEDADVAQQGVGATHVSGGDELLGLAGVNQSLVELTDALQDACRLADAMLESTVVSFAGWSGLGRIIERELRRSDAASLLAAAAEAGDASSRQEPLVALARALTPDELGEDMSEVFDAFARLLELLRFIEISLANDAQLKRVLPIFTHAYEETRALLDFIEARALRVEGLDKRTQDILDGTAYAVRMELRKAFEHELTGFCSLRQPPQIFAKVESACGLLRDCYQQSVVALAQNFDPDVDGAELFPSFQTKLEQSLILRRDLWELTGLIRRAAREGETASQTQLLESLNAFTEGSQRYLMYKDWEPLERFVEEVESARPPAELASVLHRFEAFLETLFGQVNMRAVLANYPFDPNK